jgi:hypothetical protein
MNGALWRCATSLTLMGVILSAMPAAAEYAHSRSLSCLRVQVAIDTAFADTVLPVIDSRGYGQVIATNDTLVSEVTFWKAAQPDTTPTPAILYITDADSIGTPNIIDVIYTSSVVTGGFGDGIHPIPLTFSFDPPIALPRRGLYFFDLNEQNLQFGMCIGTVRLLGARGNPYANGGAWKTGTSFCDGSGPGGLAAPFVANLDLAMDVTFCDTSVPTRRRTWGEVKLMYH